MLKYSSLPIIVALGWFAVACGSSEEGADGDGSGGTGGGDVGSGGTISLSGGSGGGAGTTSGSGARDGGVVVLTEPEIEAIGEASCAGWSAEPEGGEPAVLQFVVDTSLSMSLAPGEDFGGGFGGPGGGGGGESKWDITRAALIEAIADLPDTLPVGLFFYPNRDNEWSGDPRPLDQCVNTDEGIEVDLLTEAHRDRLLQALESTEPAGWTPTHGAYHHALETFLLPADFPGNKFMLLITDGAPTLTLECVGAGNGQFFGGSPEPVDSQPIVEEVAAAREGGVRTFLIGSPGSEPGRQWMSQAAILGATAAEGCRATGEPYCHMDMTTAPDFSQALREGLSQIADAIISCSYGFPPPPDGQSIDPDLINLIVTTGDGESQLVRPDEQGDCSEGWQFVNDEVVLCEETCQRVQNDPGVKLQLLFGCEAGVLPIPK